MGKNAGKTDSASRPRARAHRTFSDAFKREAVRRMRERRAEGVSLGQIGRELDVRPQLLWAWAQALDGQGTGRVEGLSVSPAREESLEEEVRRLRRENAMLKQEREFAKKAAAFFAKESL